MDGKMSVQRTRGLDREIRLYEAHKSEWLNSHLNEFVVVKRGHVLGFFLQFHDAYCAGAERYGVDADFLVKRVVPTEPLFAIF
jgi:hypothetical protein